MVVQAGDMTTLQPGYFDQLDASQGINQGFDWSGQDWGGMAKGFGSLAGGIGGLAQAWQGMQGLKLAKKSMAQQQENWDKNYEAQRADIAHNRGQRAAARSRQGSGYVVK